MPLEKEESRAFTRGTTARCKFHLTRHREPLAIVGVPAFVGNLEHARGEIVRSGTT